MTLHDTVKLHCKYCIFIGGFFSRTSAPSKVPDEVTMVPVTSASAASPSTSVRSNLSNSVPELKIAKTKESTNKSLPKGLDKVEIVNEVKGINISETWN